MVYSLSTHFGNVVSFVHAIHIQLRLFLPGHILASVLWQFRREHNMHISYMHTWIIATLSLKLILMMASCNYEVKFCSCQTVLSVATVSYSCGFSVDSPTIGLTLT